MRSCCEPYEAGSTPSSVSRLASWDLHSGQYLRERITARSLYWGILRTTRSRGRVARVQDRIVRRHCFCQSSRVQCGSPRRRGMVWAEFQALLCVSILIGESSFRIHNEIVSRGQGAPPHLLHTRYISEAPQWHSVKTGRAPALHEDGNDGRARLTTWKGIN